MKKLSRILLLSSLAVALSASAFAQTTIKVSQLPVPATGSTQVSNGDIVVASRGGVTYGLRAGFAGTCATSNWVNLISPQGVGTCTQPAFGDISGSLPLSQISGVYTNGQLLIGNTSSGHLQAGSLTAGSNITITPSAGGITIAAGAVSSGVVLGTSAASANPQRTGDVTTGLVSLAASSVGVDIAGTESYRFNATGLGIGTTNPASLLTVGNNAFQVNSSGNVTGGTYNGNTLTAGTYTLTGSAGKTLTFSNNLTLAGTDGTTMTFPGSSATVAGLGIAQTWLAAQTFTDGDFLLKGSSSGSMTLKAPAAASTYVMTFPAATDTVDVLGTAQSFSAAKTFPTGDIIMGGSSSGTTTFASANAGASNFTITFPATTGTVALTSGANVASVSNSDGTITISPTTGAVVASIALSHANTWGAAQTFTNSDILLLGSSTGATTFTSANAGASNFTITIPAATDTLADLAGSQTFTNKTITSTTNTIANAITPFALSTGNNTIASGATGFYGVGSECSSTQSCDPRSPCTGTISAMYTQWNGSSSATSQAYTLMKNGATTALTCTASGGSTQCSLTGQAVSVSAGDALDMKLIVGAGTGTLTSATTLVMTCN